METSGTIQALAVALCGFQAEIEAVKKDGNNPYFKSKYATLENVWDTIRPLMKKHGLALTQWPDGEDQLTTMLVHQSGEYMVATARISPKEHNPQALGSAITYMRRYAMSAILGIVTEDDDDGNAASAKPRQNAAPQQNRPTSRAQDHVSTDKNRQSRALKRMFAMAREQGINQVDFDAWCQIMSGRSRAEWSLEDIQNYTDGPDGFVGLSPQEFRAVAIARISDMMQMKNEAAPEPLDKATFPDLATFAAYLRALPGAKADDDDVPDPPVPSSLFGENVEDHYMVVRAVHDSGAELTDKDRDFVLGMMTREKEGKDLTVTMRKFIVDLKERYL